jgi:hypothetical protein
VLRQVVVLTQRSKLEMEGIFWRCLPAAKRYGTRLIFRQGSPLVPSGAQGNRGERGDSLLELRAAMPARARLASNGLAC